MWLLQMGFIRVVDKVVESTKLSFKVRRMKVACEVAGVEGGKQAVREQVASGRPDPTESSTVMELTNKRWGLSARPRERGPTPNHACGRTTILYKKKQCKKLLF